VRAQTSDPLVGQLNLVAAGDEEAFDAFYEATAGLVLGVSQRVLQNHAEAEEVRQDVYLDVWRRAATFDASRGSPRAWVRTIAHHKAVDRARSTRRAGDRERLYHDASRTQDEPDVAQRITRLEDERRLRLALADLPLRQRTVIELAYYEGRSQSEVARYLAVPLGTVKTRVRTALIALRAMLTLEPG
jgi:RNA polymerase sigma-70 factor (ECF subfamily)